MTRWIEPLRLAELVRRDTEVRGGEDPDRVILREPHVLIPVTEPGLPPLDLATYEVRRARWHDGEGPAVAGIDEFVAVLATLTEPACAVTVKGARTAYSFLLDAEMTRVLAAVAVDPPSHGGSTFAEIQ